MPEISVIVPVYKAETFINRCVDSILAQTFTNFELILVDDGSPDDSGIICDGYAKQDSRVLVVHKPNGGVSSARNAGLQKATGQWITFIDSDDYVRESYLADLYNPRYDLVVVGHEHIYGRDGSKRINGLKAFSSDSLTSTQMENLLKENGTYWLMFCWGRLYRRSLLELHNLTFVEGMDCGEDQIFDVSYITKCQSLCIKAETSYVHIASDSGTLSTTFDIAFFENIRKSEQVVAQVMEERFGLVYPRKSHDEMRLIYAGCLGGIAEDKHFTFLKKYEIFRYLFRTKLFRDTLDEPQRYYPGASRAYLMCLKMKSPMVMLLALTARLRLGQFSVRKGK